MQHVVLVRRSFLLPSATGGLGLEIGPILNSQGAWCVVSSGFPVGATTVRIKKIDDLDEARELWSDFQTMHDIGDLWPGDDHTYWELTDGKRTYAVFSAVYRPEKAYAYLSYAIIDPTILHTGLQRRLIRYRLQWARKQGAIYAVTYTLLHNYPSISNLLKCGFRFARTPRGWHGVGDGVHYFERQL